MDWEKFRAETAASVLAALSSRVGTDMDPKWEELKCSTAIRHADELIKQLKGE